MDVSLTLRAPTRQFRPYAVVAVTQIRPQTAFAAISPQTSVLRHGGVMFGVISQRTQTGLLKLKIVRRSTLHKRTSRVTVQSRNFL